MHCFFVAGISGIANVYIQFYSPDVHYTVFYNNSTKRKHSVTDKTFVTWKEKFPWLCKVEKNGIPYLQCTECISAASKGIKINSVWGHEGTPNF
jgi:hypothetical protein